MTLPIGFGTYKLGEKNKYNEKEDGELIQFAINSGYKIIDTAESYGNGYSERTIGKAIKNYNRKKIIIISKVSPDNLKYSKVIRSAKKSQERLRTYIDYYLIHMPNEKVKLSETFSAMNELKKNGIIRFYGVSNFPLELLKESFKYRIASVQEELNIAYPYNYKQLKFCKENNILFFSYMPFARGDLLNSINIANLKPFANKYNVPESIIALKWVIQHGTIPIIGSNNREHILENTLVNFKIDKEDIIKLRKLKWITN